MLLGGGEGDKCAILLHSAEMSATEIVFSFDYRLPNCILSNKHPFSNNGFSKNLKRIKYSKRGRLFESDLSSKLVNYYHHGLLHFSVFCCRSLNIVYFFTDDYFITC